VPESPTSRSAFSAAGPALGYLAQVDYALLAALERMDDEDDFTVSIETLDDIVFHDSDTDDATEKWQSKHTIDQKRSLSDASTDLWKTLGNWIAEPGDPNTRLVLLAVAEAGPTAALLRIGDDRDVARAQERLERTAQTSASDTNAGYYAAFLGLEADHRRSLLERVEIFDGVVPVAEVQSLLERPSVARHWSTGCAAGGTSAQSAIWMPLPKVCTTASVPLSLRLSCWTLPTLCAMRTCRSTCWIWRSRPSTRSRIAIGSSWRSYVSWH